MNRFDRVICLQCLGPILDLDPTIITEYWCIIGLLSVIIVSDDSPRCSAAICGCVRLLMAMPGRLLPLIMAGEVCGGLRLRSAVEGVARPVTAVGG